MFNLFAIFTNNYHICKYIDKNKNMADNTGLPKVAVQFSTDIFVVNQTLVLRINICGENRHLRQARNRWAQAVWKVNN